MRGSRALAWVLLCVWAAWLLSLQGWLLVESGDSAWVPDLGWILLVGLAARLAYDDLPWLGLSLGLARSALSIDPPVAVLAASLGAVALVRLVRTVVELKGPLFSALLAAGLSLGSSAWFELVHMARLGADFGSSRIETWLPGGLPAGASEAPQGHEAMATALATGLVALLASAALARLPGLRPLVRKGRWVVAGS